jgi:hypothetical protein
MKKTVLTFGFISGVISSLLMLLTVPFMHQIGFDKGLFVGYSAIVLSFLLVFFGIRSYRDNVGGGEITFGRAFTVGILITLISCAFYVLTWEIVYFKIMPDFGQKFAAYAIEQVKASGASQQAIDAKAVEMAAFVKSYNNPLVNMAYTFIEPFPVGLILTVISAAILRKKRRGDLDQPQVASVQ